MWVVLIKTVCVWIFKDINEMTLSYSKHSKESRLMQSVACSNVTNICVIKQYNLWKCVFYGQLFSVFQLYSFYYLLKVHTLPASNSSVSELQVK